MRKQPILLGIVGDSGTGKTTFTQGITQVLGEDRVAVICTDDYHKYNRTERAEKNLTPLHPDCNYLDIVEQHLLLVKAGQPILKPNYNHSTGDFAPPSHIQPKEFIIVEGLLGYFTKTMRDCYDVKLYLAPPDDLNVPWKIKRDTQVRGYTKEAALREIRVRKPDAEAFIYPQRKWADMTICLRPPQNRAHRADDHLNVSLILRPTLPLPDLSAVLKQNAGEPGLRWTRENDMGLPVERLEIDGNISDKTAKQLEELLWQSIPAEYQHLRRDRIDAIMISEGKKITSHPLALTQLLIAYYVLQAAARRE
jgi:phosphoribulokinase